MDAKYQNFQFGQLFSYSMTLEIDMGKTVVGYRIGMAESLKEKNIYGTNQGNTEVKT